MSNLERRPDELDCSASATAAPGGPGGPGVVELLDPREVPLGGPRAMRVRRTLPQRARSLVGAWCFVDHYGPDPVADSGGMVVAPHPHTGLQTVSWLFAGEIEHRDSAGHHALVRPGELNLMTAGHGISHSEVSTARTDLLHGVQLWVALPDAARDGRPGFVHHAPDRLVGDGWTARVFLGTLLGRTSPVPTATPLLGAELTLAAGAVLEVDVDPDFEHGVLVDTGVLGVAASSPEPVETVETVETVEPVEPVETKQHQLAYLAPGTASLRLTAYDAPARLLLLGGPPFAESIVMWWNFVGRSHEEIVGFRAQWQAQLAGGRYADGRFGVPRGDRLAPLPAPELPRARLRPRT